MKLKIQTLFRVNNITNIAFNSKDITNDSAFFAIKGQHYNGNNYIDDAFNNGAIIVFTDDPMLKQKNVVYVDDVRKALAIAASILYYKLPKNIIAVTGTNGKSSVVSYIYQILSLLNQEVASIGTLGIESTKTFTKNIIANKNSNLTTSDPISFRHNIHMLFESGIDNIAFEASSHGIDQQRLGDIKATSAAFTSFSQDHLDYHHNMENYLNVKLSLFKRNLMNEGEAVINSEIMCFDVIKQYFIDNKINYSTVGIQGDLKIIQCNQSIAGQKIICEFRHKKYEFISNIIGSFQAANILIAAKLVYNLGIEFAYIINILPKLKAVCGRLQRITQINDSYQVFVDYAHTPDSLKQSLLELQKIKNKSGELYVIFGCGGDRDKVKRPVMGAIAADIADRIVITDDNPRNEEPHQIRQDIIGGIANNKQQFMEEIPDRKQAISSIIVNLKKNDILLIAGKGHEDYQIIGNKSIKFSDIEIAKNIIKIDSSNRKIENATY